MLPTTIGSATPPTIAGTALIFSNVAAAEINVSGSAPIGASITAPITTAAAGIVKKGNSTLVLNAANTYTATNADTAFVLEDGDRSLATPQRLAMPPTNSSLATALHHRAAEPHGQRHADHRQCDDHRPRTSPLAER